MGQDQSAKKRSHSSLWEAFPHDIPKHKRKRRENYFVFLFRHQSKRTCAQASSPRAWAAQTCCIWQYLGCCLLLRVKSTRKNQIRYLNIFFASDLCLITKTCQHAIQNLASVLILIKLFVSQEHGLHPSAFNLPDQLDRHFYFLI